LRRGRLPSTRELFAPARMSSRTERPCAAACSFNLRYKEVGISTVVRTASCFTFLLCHICHKYGMEECPTLIVWRTHVARRIRISQNYLSTIERGNVLCPPSPMARCTLEHGGTIVAAIHPRAPFLVNWTFTGCCPIERHTSADQMLGFREISASTTN